jgi:hypothetical protein
VLTGLGECRSEPFALVFVSADPVTRADASFPAPLFPLACSSYAALATVFLSTKPNIFSHNRLLAHRSSRAISFTAAVNSASRRPVTKTYAPSFTKRFAVERVLGSFVVSNGHDS